MVSFSITKKELEMTNTNLSFYYYYYYYSLSPLFFYTLLLKGSSAYSILKDAHRNPDGYAQAFTQTLNNTKKDQNDAAVPAPLHESACQATSFEIEDAMDQYRKLEEDALVGVGT